MELFEDIRLAYATAVVMGAWIAFADHPTARSPRTGILDSLAL